MGVDGLKVTPAFMPCSRMRAKVLSRCVEDSTCTAICCTPIFASFSIKKSLSSTMRCTSNGRAVFRRICSIIASPRGRLGTKCASIISMCSRSTPMFSSFCTSASRLHRSAHIIEGDMSILFCVFMVGFLTG